MLLGTIDVYSSKIYNIRNKICNAEDPEFDLMALNLSRSNYSSPKGNKHCQNTAERIPCNIEKDVDEHKWKDYCTVCICHVVIYKEENRLYCLLYQYHGEEMMEENELTEVFEAEVYPDGVNQQID